MQKVQNLDPNFQKERVKDMDISPTIQPNFDFTSLNIGVEEIKKDAKKVTETFDALPHNDILKKLLDHLQKADFRKLAEFEDEKEVLQKKHFCILSVEQIVKAAINNNWGLCKSNGFIYLYNGAFWRLFDAEEFKEFLGTAAEKLGVGKFDARFYEFREKLYKQFLAVSNLPKPEGKKEVVLINLKNGTFEISPKKQVLRDPNRADFMTYQLPFSYDKSAKAPLFKAYLDKVQPNVDCQKVLAEYLAYVFIKPSTLKLEKTLLLYGTGANGKSVFFEIVNALLGKENVCSYSLGSLTDENGYHRAKLNGKLVNYSSEINGKLEASIFKQLVSGEPVEARLPYQEPFIMTEYAKLIFNCNELPKDTEQTHAFFRRFLIIPFNVTIEEKEQDKTLSQKIIDSELSGVFNWVLEGLGRLLSQKNFTHCEAVRQELENYKLQSDSVQQFLEEENYTPSVSASKPLKDLYLNYKSYTFDSGFRPVSIQNFSNRLKNCGYSIERKTGRFE
jgi:putative DNA primase/helicase